MAGPLAAAGIAAGAQLIGSGANWMAQGKINRDTQIWNQQMYDRQRKDALADWNMQNAFNHPAAQMQRLREAGINPALIYGKGTDVSAGPVRSSSAPGWNPQAPDLSGIGRAASDAIQAYTAQRMMNEQLKTMEQQRQNMTLDALLKGVSITGNQLKNAKTGMDLDLKRDTYDATVKKANEAVRAMQVGTDIKIAKEVRDQVMHAPTFAEAVSRVAKIAADTKIAQQQFENLKGAKVLQDTEIALRKSGLSWNDSVVLRALSQFAGGKPLPEAIGDIWNTIKDTFGNPGASFFPDRDTRSFSERLYKSYDKRSQFGKHLDAGMRHRLDSLNLKYRK